VIFALPRSLDHFIDDVSGRRLIRVAHPEVDDVLASMPSFELKALNLSEDVGGEPLEPVKII
jgi:hypothetical protein